MARGKRIEIPIDKQIEDLEAGIDKQQQKLKEMKQQLKLLQERKKEKDKDDLYDLVAQSGKNIEEIKKLLGF